MTRNLALLALTGTLFLGACSTGTDAPKPPVQVTTGAVTFTKDATVTATVRNASGTVVTNYDTLAPGTYTVVFSREGYISSNPIQFTVTAGSTTNVQAPTLQQVGATTGAVTFIKDVNVTATVRDAQGNAVPATNLNSLAPGTYTVVFSREGYTSSSPIEFTIRAGQVTTVQAPALTPVNTTPTPSGTGAYYMIGTERFYFTQEDLQNAGSRFVFYAWLENEVNSGVNPANLAGGSAPNAGEQDEVAPLNRQNLAAGYVGYRAADGNIYPVYGAGVRWDINEDKSQTAVRIATADDGAIASGAMRPQDVNDNAMSATTFTNRAGNTSGNTRFPSSADYPLHNMTGVNTPDTDGFTWMALWVPNGGEGQATVTAIAEINGTEINKAVLTKRFAPSAELTVTKTVAAGEGTRGLFQDATFTVTVTNEGEGPATGIQLEDRLTSGSDNAYSIDTPDGGTLVGDSGFNATFDLAPGESRTFTFEARSGAVGVFCDTATITQFNNGAFGLVQNPDVEPASACFTVQAPELTVTKTLVDAQNNPIPSGQEVGINQEVFALITVRNGGNAAATNVVVTDQLTSANGATYAIRTPAQGTTANGDDGFTSEPVTLAPGESRTFRFGAVGSADGEYCDTATVTAISNNGATLTDTSDVVCFEVTSPVLTLEKVNNQLPGQPATTNLYPGNSYESVITVRNTGTGAATNVAVQDILGRLAAQNRFVLLGGGSYSISGGTQNGSISLSNNTVTTAPANLTLPAGETLTLRLTSTIPAQAPEGQYCDVASVTATGVARQEAEACVTVLNFISVQTQMTDTKDPITANGTDSTILSSALIVEPQSNEGADTNVVTFNFGSQDPDGNTQGVFDVTVTEVYYDATPTRDQQTGAVTSDFTRPGTQRLVQGTDYVITVDDLGRQVVDFRDDFAIQPGGVVFFRHTVTAPATVAAGQYFSGFQWVANGTNTNDVVRGDASEPTTVIGGTTATPLRTGNSN